jgi:sulfur relay (sulfurtransferase) complex TusBCD TusD component (DsrE family)
MTIGFLLRTGPYTSQNVDTCYHLAKRFLAKGHEVKMFLYEDGVFNLAKEIRSPQERNLAEMMVELASLGAEIQGCGTCAAFRGLKKQDVIEGSKLGGMVVLANYVNSCDRFLSFGF